MNFLIFLVLTFLCAIALMYLIALSSNSTKKAVLVRAGVVASTERPPVGLFKKLLGSPEKRKIVDSKGNPLIIHFGYKQRVPKSREKKFSYGKAVGDSMANRGIKNGGYFIFEQFSTSDEVHEHINVGDIVVAKIVDDCADKGGYKLREIERLVDTAHYHGITYKNGSATNEGEKRHLLINIAGKVTQIIA